MRTAWITLRHQPPYRSDAFAAGFEALGFTVSLSFPNERAIKPSDVVVTWNLNPRYQTPANLAVKAGAALIVAENGYIPKARATTPYYALARNGHNGSGMWFVGKENRWADLGRRIKPWQDRSNGYILIADQRGIGSELMRCPRPFYETVVPRIRHIFAKVDKRAIPHIKLREHPGRGAPQNSLAADLEGARAVVTWASNVANVALLEGIPAFRVAPYFVNSAALSDLNQLPAPPQPNRDTGFFDLAWAQWSLDEISDGTAFRCLLQDVM